MFKSRFTRNRGAAFLGSGGHRRGYRLKSTFVGVRPVLPESFAFLLNVTEFINMPAVEFEVSSTMESRREVSRSINGFATKPAKLLNFIDQAGWAGLELTVFCFSIVLFAVVFFGYTPDPSHGWEPFNIGVCAGVALFPFACAAWVIYSVKLDREQERRPLQPTCGSSKFRIDDEAISGVHPEGAHFSHPWSSFLGFYAGRNVFIAPMQLSPDAPGRPMQIIPTVNLSENQVQEIRSLLARHLPEMSKKSLAAYFSKKSD